MANVAEIKILDEVVVDAGDATDVEAPFEFSDIQRAWLADVAAKYGKIVLRVKFSSKTGSPVWEIRTVSLSYDGTNWAIAQDLAPIDGGSDGEMSPVEMDLAMFGANPLKVRLDADVTTLGAGDKITIEAWLVIVCPND